MAIESYVAQGGETHTLDCQIPSHDLEAILYTWEGLPPHAVNHLVPFHHRMLIDTSL